MTTPRTIVIVGASLAGAKAAETLRDEGYDGRLVLVGDDPERPYERPPLSKDYLRGGVARDTVHVHEAGFYDERAIELRTGTRATAIDAADRTVTLGGHSASPGTACCSRSAPSRAGLRYRRIRTASTICEISPTATASGPR